MADRIFEALLIHKVRILRPQTGSRRDRNLRQPAYVPVYPQAQKGRVMPLRVETEQTILGAFPGATHALFTGVLDIRPQYRVRRELAMTKLVEPTQPGILSAQLQTVSQVQPGQVLMLSFEGQTEAVSVESVSGSVVTLRQALDKGFPAGADVEVLEEYEVLGVEDEGGAGHHLKSILRLVEA